MCLLSGLKIVSVRHPALCLIHRRPAGEQVGARRGPWPPQPASGPQKEAAWPCPAPSGPIASTCRSRHVCASVQSLGWTLMICFAAVSLAMTHCPCSHPPGSVYRISPQGKGDRRGILLAHPFLLQNHCHHATLSFQQLPF